VFEKKELDTVPEEFQVKEDRLVWERQEKKEEEKEWRGKVLGIEVYLGHFTMS
jgi:hypothetical protein